MSHIVESCPLTKLNGGLSRLHSDADEDAVSWLTTDQLWFMTHIREAEECSTLFFIFDILFAVFELNKTVQILWYHCITVLYLLSSYRRILVQLHRDADCRITRMKFQNWLNNINIP